MSVLSVGALHVLSWILMLTLPLPELGGSVQGEHCVAGGCGQSHGERV
jgi:hypothetical protein